MILSDQDITESLEGGLLVVKPNPTLEAIQPASLDLHLGGWLRTFNGWSSGTIDPYDRDTYEDATRLVDMYHRGCYVVRAGEFLLASTVEYVELPNTMAGRLEGKSSLGRLGLQIHSTAGFIDPGFCGHPTLELCNVVGRPIKLTPNMPICQIAFFWLNRPASRYSGKYQGQGNQPAPSQYYRNRHPMGELA